MHTICLKDNWTLTVLGKNVYDIPETPIETKVPSTAVSYTHLTLPTILLV